MSNGSASYYTSHPPPMRRGQRLLYLRIAGIAVVLLIVLFVLYPSDRKATVEEFIHGRFGPRNLGSHADPNADLWM